MTQGIARMERTIESWETTSQQTRSWEQGEILWRANNIPNLHIWSL